MTGNSFNGAATLSLRKLGRMNCVDCGKEALQWGRNFIVAETSQVRALGHGDSGASMGPQLYRCGNWQPHRQRQRKTPLASMGPQLYRCGNACFRRAPSLCACALQWGRNFIVAETHGKRDAAATTPYTSFNGAATLSLRKQATARRSVHHAERQASMGPQLYRCGNVGRACPTTRICIMLQWGRNFIVAETLITCTHDNPEQTMLQWGLNFIVAETHLCGVDAIRRVDWLQWGRNFIVAETWILSAGSLKHRFASMGPQLYRCGNSAVNRCGLCRRRASMGPQLYRCGNQPRLDEVHSASMGPQLYRCGNSRAVNRCGLWPSSFNGAATLSLRKRASTRRPETQMPRFNGAATLSLRKHDNAGVREQNQALASMGPQLYRCGNLEGADGGGHPDQASMGPQLYRCGNKSFRPVVHYRDPGFNGAATLSLRKPHFQQSLPCI